MVIIKFIEYSRKCNKGDCRCYKKFKFSIELFDAITGEFIRKNQEDFTYVYDFTKVCNKGIMNLFYQKIINKNMG